MPLDSRPKEAPLQDCPKVNELVAGEKTSDPQAERKEDHHDQGFGGKPKDGPPEGENEPHEIAREPDGEEPRPATVLPAYGMKLVREHSVEQRRCEIAHRCRD